MGCALVLGTGRRSSAKGSRSPTSWQDLQRLVSDTLVLTSDVQSALEVDATPGALSVDAFQTHQITRLKQPHAA